jgi:hypothetical protein
MNILISSILVFFLYFTAGPASRIIQDDDLKLLQEKTLTTEAGKTLTLSSSAGAVNIIAGTTNEVLVKIYGNENAESAFVFNVYNVDKGIKVDGQKKSSDFSSIKLRFDITVPANYNVDIYTGGGEVSITGINGNSKVSTSGGKIEISKTNGNIDASTMGGKIMLSDNIGNSDVSTSGGKIEAYNFNGNISASTQGGSINLTGSNGSIKAYTGGGSIDLDYSGVNKGIDISTMGGSIKVDLPSDFDADADVSTMVGKIKCDFAQAEKGMVSSYIKTKFNNGGEPFKCSTMAGSISISKKPG